MKSEERHELKSNDLETFVNKIKPVLEKHGNKIIFGTIAALVIGGISVLAMNKSRNAKNAGWAAMADASTSEDFANIVDDNKGTPVARMAQLSQANLLIDNGVRFMFTDRSAGNSDLKKASELYEGLLNEKTTSPGVREQALYGRARCLEATSGENTQEAIEAYEQLLQEFSETIYRGKAETRIKALATAESKDFYSWFQKQNPKPVDRTKPKDGVTPDTSSKPEDVVGDKAEDTKPDSESKKEESAKTPVEKPAEKKAETEKPVEKKAEADKKPAVDKKETGKKDSSGDNKKETADKKEPTDKK